MRAAGESGLEFDLCGDAVRANRIAVWLRPAYGSTMLKKNSKATMCSVSLAMTS